MQYILTGFTQDLGYRVFAFQGVDDARVKTDYKVRADLSLIRQYGIRVQELPLLCRALLEKRTEGEPGRAYTFTEADMSIQAGVNTAREAAHKRKAPRKPPPVENAGAAWRGPQPALPPTQG